MRNYTIRYHFKIPYVAPQQSQERVGEKKNAWCTVIAHLLLHQEARCGNTMKPLNSGHLRALKNLSVIERFPILGGNLKKIVTFGT